MKVKFLPKNQLLGSGALLLLSTLFVNIGNYAFNLAAGRMVNPAVFGEISLLVTLLLAVSFVAIAFQLTSSRFVTAHTYLTRVAWQGGVGLAVLLALLALPLQQFFQLSSTWPLLLIALSIPVYFAMSVGRGSLQGQLTYNRLAGTYQIEMWVRLLVGLSLLALGWGGNGIAVALLISLLACYWYTRKQSIPVSENPNSAEQKQIITFFTTTLLYELSQILINNSDVLMVKHYFNSHDAGLYTSLSLIGRIVYFGTWSVVMVLFPKVVEQRRKGLSTSTLFWGGLAIVGLVSASIVLACLLFPQLIVNLLFGNQYVAASTYLWTYALATSFFALANVFVYYYLSLDRRTPVWFSVVAGLLQIGLMLGWHDTFAEVIGCQVVAMGSLLLALLIYHIGQSVSAYAAAAENAGSTNPQYLPSAN